MTRRLPYDSAVATGAGDDGTTGLLFGGARIAKDDPRTEAYGTVDEAVAALGVARALVGGRVGRRPHPGADLAPVLLELQRALFVVGAELATNPEAVDRAVDGVSRVSEAMVHDLDARLREAEAAITMPREFVVPGETAASAAIEVARTVVRRAERRVVQVHRGDLPKGGWVVPYLNRLADLLWVLARVAEQREATTARPARVARHRGARPAATENER